MKQILHAMTLLTIMLLAGCSGGPSDRQIAEAMEQKMKTEITQQLETMKAIGGQKGVDMAQTMDIPDPEKIAIEELSSEDMIKSDNGDYTAKITFTTVVGDKKGTGHARITLSEVDGDWRVVSLEEM